VALHDPVTMGTGRLAWEHFLVQPSAVVLAAQSTLRIASLLVVRRGRFLSPRVASSGWILEIP